MYQEKKIIGGEVYNPFTNEYNVFYEMNGEKEWVSPKVKKIKFHSNWRAIKSGNVIEISKYEEPIFYGYDSKVSSGKKKISNEQSKRSDNILRAKSKIRRLINSNIQNNSKFVTLTYAENMTDIKKAKDDFKKFVKRLNYKLEKENQEKLKYLYVVEFQERGAVHFHCVFFNLNYMKNEELQKVWRQGFVKINRIDNVDNVGAYVVKYMNKELSDNRLNNSDLYGRSRGLKEPEIIKKPEEVKALLQTNKRNITFFKSYQSDYKGNIFYCQINTKRDVEELESENIYKFMVNGGFSS